MDLENKDRNDHAQDKPPTAEESDPGKEERERAEAQERERAWKVEQAERTDLRRRNQG